MLTSGSSVPTRSRLIVRPATWRQVGTDLAYILPGFFMSLVSFSVLVTLFAVGVSTFIIWIGLPALMLCMAVARGLATVNRAALTRWGGDIPPVH